MSGSIHPSLPGIAAVLLTFWGASLYPTGAGAPKNVGGVILVRKVWSSPADRGFARSLAISSDGLTLAVSFPDKQLTTWRLADGKEEKRFPISATIAARQMKFQPKGTTLAAMHTLVGSDSVSLWDLAKGRELFTIEPPAPLTSTTWHPDGSSLVTASRDRSGKKYALTFWNAATGKEVKNWPASGFLRSLAFSPDSRLLVGCSGNLQINTLRVWDVKTGQEKQPLLILRDRFPKLCFSPDSKWIAIGGSDGPIQVIDTEGTVIRTLERPKGSLFDLAYFPNGKAIVGAMRDSESFLIFWNPVDGKVVGRHTGVDIVHVAISPDGRFLVGGGKEGVHVFNVNPDAK